MDMGAVTVMVSREARVSVPVLPALTRGADEPVAVAPQSTRRFATVLTGDRLQRPAVGGSSRLDRAGLRLDGLLSLHDRTTGSPVKRLAERQTQIPPTRTLDMVNPIAELVQLLGYTTEVALNDPIAGILILVSNLILGVSIIVFFGLAAGGILDWIMPEDPSRSPPQQGR